MHLKRTSVRLLADIIKTFETKVNFLTILRFFTLKSEDKSRIDVSHLDHNILNLKKIKTVEVEVSALEIMVIKAVPDDWCLIPFEPPLLHEHPTTECIKFILC